MDISTDYSKTYLLPPSLEDWVSEDHPVRFIREFVDTINLAEYGFKDSDGEEGRPRYSNNLLLKIWLYSYYEKIYSTRQIEKACINQMPLLWLTTMLSPDHNTIWRFFKTYKGEIQQIFKHTVEIKNQEANGKSIPSDKLPKSLYGKKKLQQLIKEGVEELREEEKERLKEN